MNPYVRIIGILVVAGVLVLAGAILGSYRERSKKTSSPEATGSSTLSPTPMGKESCPAPGKAGKECPAPGKADKAAPGAPASVEEPKSPVSFFKDFLGIDRWSPTAAPTPLADEYVAVVNVKCPMTGKDIDPAKVKAELTREFKGHKVGFCCGGCPGPWDKLTDAEKQAKLDKVMPEKKALAPAGTM